MYSNNNETIKDNLVIQGDTITEKQRFFSRLVTYFEEAKKDKSESEFDISFIGGPSYSVNTKLGIGIMASGLYRVDRNDLTLAPSSVSIYTNLTTSGFFSIGMENHTIFKEDKYRLIYDLNFAYKPTRYYGIGYLSADQGQYSEYDDNIISFKADMVRRILPNFYAGISLNASNNNARKFTSKLLQPDQPLTNTSIGVGYILSYDSRDFIPNAYEGIFIQFEQTFFTKALGSSQSFNRIEFTTRAYREIWPSAILAFDFNGIFNNGDVPWTMLSLLGDSRQMRGYYNGQYRDKKQLNSQVELRQKIYNRHGIALWAGAGNVFDDLNTFQWDQTLPTYGIGYRWQFKNRINVRLDYGIGKGQSGFYFNVNESF